MLAIKLPSIQRYTRVDFMPADTKNVRGVILNLLHYAQTDHKDPKFVDELTDELALLERFDMMNSVFVTFSLDENNDTLIINDSFQNGQQMLELTQTTQGLLHQIDIKRASFSNQGDLLLSVTYQKED